MISCTSINGHVKHPAGYTLVAAQPEGDLFRLDYTLVAAQLDYTGLKRLSVYYTTDFGRELFRVERDLPVVKVSRLRAWFNQLWTRWITKPEVKAHE